MAPPFDLAIIGGGINGCGVAARRGRARAHGLSSARWTISPAAPRRDRTKLIHGGLRYLEYYDFRLVREALREREVLLRAAPHIVRPLRIVLPFRRGLRPAWLLRLGLFLYDHMGGRKLLPATRTLDLARDAAGAPLKPKMFRTGFEFSDCRVDDARLVVLNACDAAARGAVIRTRTRVVSAARRDRNWELVVEDMASGRRETVAAGALVNAAGPWVEQMLAACLGSAAAPREHVRLVQGSHIVVPQPFAHDRAYMFQNPDGRIVFAIPYEDAHTLIGTTDRDYAGDPALVAATPEEVSYLCEAASEYFARPISAADVVWSFSGVRPLHDDNVRDAKAATRDYVLELDATPDGAPLLSIFGGKITTYRRLAEAALEKLAPFLPARGRPWTRDTPLPGGDFAVDGAAALASELAAQYPFLTATHASRLIAAYGTRAKRILAGARTSANLGLSFGVTLTETEVRYLMAEEFATTAEDVLWRRTKLGLVSSDAEAAGLERFMASVGGATAAT